VGIVKTASRSGFGGNSASGGADEKPFGGAADATGRGALFCESQYIKE
jgi:hypothetical protein